MLEAQNCSNNPRSGVVAAVTNGSGLVCKPYANYRTFVCTTELKRQAANYSETGVGVGGGDFERARLFNFYIFISKISRSKEYVLVFQLFC